MRVPGVRPIFTYDTPALNCGCDPLQVSSSILLLLSDRYLQTSSFLQLSKGNDSLHKTPFFIHLEREKKTEIIEPRNIMKSILHT